MRNALRRQAASRVSRGSGAMLAALLIASPVGAQTANMTPDRSLRWGELRFHYELEPNRTDRIALVATVTNTGRRVVELRLPWCLAWLQVFRDGRRIWDRGEADGCAEMKRFVNLQPGESERERYAVLARDLPGVTDEGAEVEVRAHLPSHRVPWLPPRAAVDLRMGTVTLAVPTRSEGDDATSEFARTLGVPGLPWGASAGTVRERLTEVGFRPAGSDPNGSLLFNGHDFLGRNAGLIARMDDGRLVKLVALMEPRAPSRHGRSDFRELRETLQQHYGEPERTGERPHPLALWERRRPSGLHTARLTVTDEGHLRLDLEPPAWKGRYREWRAAPTRP